MDQLNLFSCPSQRCVRKSFPACTVNLKSFGYTFGKTYFPFDNLNQEPTNRSVPGYQRNDNEPPAYVKNVVTQNARALRSDPRLHPHPPRRYLPAAQIHNSPWQLNRASEEASGTMLEARMLAGPKRRETFALRDLSRPGIDRENLIEEETSKLNQRESTSARGTENGRERNKKGRGKEEREGRRRMDRMRIGDEK